MIFIPHNQATEVLKPSEEAFDIPSALHPTQRTTILGCGLLPIRTVRSDQLDSAFFAESFVKAIAIVSLVADEVSGTGGSPGLLKRLLNQRYFVRRSAGHVDGERKTATVCNCHDLAAFAPLGLPDLEPPFLAPAKEPSMKASAGLIAPRSSKSSANARKIASKTPARVHAWNLRWQVWYGGYRSGRSFQGAPVRRIQSMPFRISRGSLGGRPRPPGLRREGGMSGSTRHHCWLVRSMNHRSDPSRLKLTYF
jgi:hypothetical protein